MALYGLLLVPATLATLYHLPVVAATFQSNGSVMAWMFLGAVIYAIFEAVFSRPMRTYVFGHELTHALASVAMGGKVHEFHVSKDGGHVKLSKTNFFVALAPYCVPLYAAIVLIVYQGFRVWYPFPYMNESFQSLLGASLAFHASLTVYAIRQEQPDIRKTGTFFSAVFILLVNAWMIVLLSNALFGVGLSLRRYALDTFGTQWVIWKWLYAKGVIGAKWIYSEWQKRGGELPQVSWDSVKALWAR